MKVKTVRKNKKIKIKFKETNKSKLLKKACKKFKKPIYLMRHLHTNSNLVTDNILFKTLIKKKAQSFF